MRSRQRRKPVPSRNAPSSIVMGTAAILIAIGIFVSITAAAQPTFVTLVIDNDWFVHKDRHYTSGSHIEFVKDIDTLPSSVRGFSPLAWSADADVWSSDRDFAGTGVATAGLALL